VYFSLKEKGFVVFGKKEVEGKKKTKEKDKHFFKSET